MSKSGAAGAGEHVTVHSTATIDFTAISWCISCIRTFRQQTRAGATVGTFVDSAVIGLVVETNIELCLAYASDAIFAANTATRCRLLHQQADYCYEEQLNQRKKYILLEFICVLWRNNGRQCAYRNGNLCVGLHFN